MQSIFLWDSFALLPPQIIMSYLTISQQTLADTAFYALMLMKREETRLLPSKPAVWSIKNARQLWLNYDYEERCNFTGRRLRMKWGEGPYYCQQNVCAMVGWCVSYKFISSFNVWWRKTNTGTLISIPLVCVLTDQNQTLALFYYYYARTNDSIF